MVESIIFGLTVLGALAGGYAYFRSRRIVRKNHRETTMADNLEELEEIQAKSRLSKRFFASFLGKLLRP